MTEAKSVYRNHEVLHTVLLKPVDLGAYAVVQEDTGEWLITLPSQRMARLWADAYLEGWGKGYDRGTDSGTREASGIGQDYFGPG